jgi:hypothetical protein
MSKITNTTGDRNRTEPTVGRLSAEEQKLVDRSTKRASNRPAKATSVLRRMMSQPLLAY